MGFARIWRLILCIALVLVPASLANAAAARQQAHRHFRTAIYVTVADVKRLADPATFNREFARVSSQLKFDKVWIEAYRDRLFATDAELETVKREFQSKGSRPRAGSPSPPAARAASSGPSITRIRPTSPSASARCA